MLCGKGVSPTIPRNAPKIGHLLRTSLIFSEMIRSKLARIPPPFPSIADLRYSPHCDKTLTLKHPRAPWLVLERGIYGPVAGRNLYPGERRRIPIRVPYFAPAILHRGCNWVRSVYLPMQFSSVRKCRPRARFPLSQGLI